eukprot:TRINITY_DN3489_c0_g1_i1.p1 TRINITY_DN3489_c0_g1~~TRINITY_DN3489_c0_g1_i1.p1  ORF type:complete len:766 (-),score=60.30 TRINITY_DN3489_c0_g1_i1:97-2298(-)
MDKKHCMIPQRSLLDAIASNPPQHSKLVLTNQQLTCIAPKKTNVSFTGIKKLYLSYNMIQSLEGIQAFGKLEQLSLAFNHLLDVEALFLLASRYTLKHLSVRGNFLDRHPDYQRILINHFPGLLFLDGFEITPQLRKDLAESLEMERQIISFIHYLQETHIKIGTLLEILRLNAKLGQCDIKSLADDLVKHKNVTHLLQIISATTKPVRINLIKKIMDSASAILIDESTAEKLCESLYMNIITDLRAQGKRDLERYLSYQVLKNDAILFETLKRQISANNPNVILTEAKYVEYAVELLLKEASPVDYEKIYYEQFRQFLKLCSCKVEEIQTFRTEKMRSPFYKVGTFTDRERYEDADNGYKFPLFPLNEDYMNSFWKYICKEIGNAGAVYEEAIKVLIENYSEARRYIEGEVGIAVEENEWLSSKTAVQTEEKVQDLPLKRPARKILQIFAQRLAVISQNLLQRTADKEVKLEFITRLKQIAKVKSEGVAGFSRALSNILGRVLHNYTNVLTTYAIEQSEAERSISEASKARAEHKCLEILKANASHKKQRREKIERCRKGKLLTKVLSSLKSLLRLRNIGKQIKDLHETRTLRSCFEKLFSAKLSHLNDKMTLDRTLNRSTLADTNPDVSGMPTFIQTIKEYNDLSATTKIENNIDELIENVLKMKQACVKRIQEENEFTILDITKSRHGLCSVKCKGKLPSYLKQERLPLGKSAHPWYQSKTLSTVAKMMQ